MAGRFRVRSVTDFPDGNLHGVDAGGTAVVVEGDDVYVEL
jgi:hypothetical protein